MNKHLISITSALAIAVSGGLAYAQSQGTSSGVPGVEANVGANASNDGGVPGVEMNIGANGDQRNVGSDASTLGAGPATTDSGTDLSARVDRN